MKSKLDNCEKERDVGGIWRNIKGFLGWSGSGGAPIQLTDPKTGQLTDSPIKMAEIQNQYHEDKVNLIRQKLLEKGDPTANLRKIMRERPQARMKGLTLRAVYPDEINNIIKNLRNSKSCGLDNLESRVAQPSM